MKKIIPLLISVFVLIGGCTPKEEPHLTVEPGSTAFTEDGGSQMLRVTSNNPGQMVIFALDESTLNSIYE